jgi:hypothetical protein
VPPLQGSRTPCATARACSILGATFQQRSRACAPSLASASGRRNISPCALWVRPTRFSRETWRSKGSSPAVNDLSPRRSCSFARNDGDHGALTRFCICGWPAKIFQKLRPSRESKVHLWFPINVARHGPLFTVRYDGGDSRGPCLKSERRPANRSPKAGSRSIAPFATRAKAVGKRRHRPHRIKKQEPEFRCRFE